MNSAKIKPQGSIVGPDGRAILQIADGPNGEIRELEAKPVLSEPDKSPRSDDRQPDDLPEGPAHESPTPPGDAPKSAGIFGTVGRFLAFLPELQRIAVAQQEIARFLGSNGPTRRRWRIFGPVETVRPWGPLDLIPQERYVLSWILDGERGIQTLWDRSIAHGRMIRKTRVQVGLEIPTPAEAEAIREEAKIRQQMARRVVGATPQQAAAIRAIAKKGNGRK